MRATLTYSLLRLLIFVAAGLILALCGVRGFPLLIAALIISSIISLLLLSKLRDRMSTSLSGRISRFGSKLDAGTKAEDTD
jgi:small-conductance mechanosensitive channel